MPDNEASNVGSAPQQRFSIRRIGYLLLIVLGVIAVRAAVRLPRFFAGQQAQENQAQEKHNRDVARIQQAVQQGQGGEAFNRLFGQPATPSSQKSDPPTSPRANTRPNP
ncbi:MAG TPA: hypothetical protein VHZ24_05615 [Pirellulales bacterium]|nr:hypothetical protein [Pirellulales bacterium]